MTENECMCDVGVFFDQLPEVSSPPIKMLATTDIGCSYEVDEYAVFKLQSGTYAYIAVSGCSCWPDRGSTVVIEAKTLGELQDKVHNEDREYNLTFTGEAELFNAARDEDNKSKEEGKWYEREQTSEAKRLQ